MTTTITSLPRMTASTLSSLVLAQSSNPNPSMAIIDVRDDDHIGGHILGSQHVPSATLDHKIPELVRKLQDKDTVVFHCALSQQRGPGAALKYLRERERLLGAVPQSAEKAEKGEGDRMGEEMGGVKDKEGLEGDEGKQKGIKDQKVYVLDQGFVGWQETFGEDERLTEGYSKELWKDGYWM